MITLAWYLLKVIICSGILCGYYFLALRNKSFHRWNRFYLLAAILISLLAPVMKINIFQTGEDKGTVVQMLQTISYGDEAVIQYSRNSGFELTTENVTEAAYLLISAAFLFIFLLSIYKIKRLRKKYPETKIEDVSFINTSEKGTPFSFFKLIFWNQAIDLHSKSGQQIFNHEIAHVKEKHSYDKIFMNIVLVFFWINPFFWLMRKELYMIHEFIADKEALEDSDINAFAEMILQTVYPGQHFSSTNSFFYSPIKRRLLMLTKNKNPKVSYISRLLVLPLAAIVFFAFTLKIKNKNANLYDGKTITVVIDAGHGGADNGAVSENGLKEKDITLSIAKKIAALNSNDHIKILLSRDDDQTIPVKDRVAYSEKNKADLFISIHVNSSADKQINGFSVLVDKQNSEQDLELGSSLINALKESYKTEDKIGVRKNGILVLDKNVCPAALIECGFLSNSNDAAFISNKAGQEKIAKNILDAVNNYAASNVNSSGDRYGLINDDSSGISAIKDTIPYSDGSKETIAEEESLKKAIVLSPPPNALVFIDGKKSSKDEMKNIPSSNIQSINVLKGETAIKKYGEKGKNGVIEITTKKDDYSVIGTTDTLYISGFSSKPITQNTKITTKVAYINSKIPEGVLIFADGKEISQEEMKNIPPNSIRSVNVLKGESAVEKYGDKAKDGSIEIILKKNLSVSHAQDTLAPLPTSIYNGKKVRSVEAISAQKVLIHFRDGTKKTISTAEAKKAGFIIFTPPRVVKDHIPDKVFTKVENEASFPGGPIEWRKYIVKQIQASIDSFTEADYGTCVVKFIVNTDGAVSNVEATTMKGTHLAKISVNAIKNGPEWIPASQNGHSVASYRLQPVTLSNPQEATPDKTESTKKSNAINTKDDNRKVFIKLEKTASFPGGKTAWLKYISRAIQKNGNELIADKNSEGTCEVKFIVSANGEVSDVKAITKQGSRLADVAVNAIKEGPRWIPGMQNGYEVNSYVIMPVSFVLNDELTVKGQTLRVIHLSEH